jgi:GNAT superfamily N-acetyltransferase
MKHTCQLFRTVVTNPDFKLLVTQLDAYLAVADGEDHAFYDQFNKIEQIKYAVVAFENNEPVGCGAIKALSDEAMEVKRMFVIPGRRGKGIALAILDELEKWTAELGYSRCILETGSRQVEAIALYEKASYKRIPNYGQYVGVDNSRCFEKLLK